MLARIRGRVEEIEATNDRPAMRGLIELLVPSIVLRTELVGEKRVRQRKRVTLHLTLAFAHDCDVVSITDSRGGSGSACPPSGTGPASSST